MTCTNAAVGLVDGPSEGNSGFTISVSIAGSSSLPGWGGSKDFTSMLGDAKALVLHPVANADDVLTGDTTFWKAYPMLKSIKQSGDNPKMVEVDFVIFPDSSKPKAIRLFAYGATS